MTLTELDDWEYDVVQAFVVDFDQRRVIWLHDDRRLEIPKVAAAYSRLLSTALARIRDGASAIENQLAEALGIELMPEDDAEDSDAPLHYRSETVTEAGLEEHYEDEDEERDDEEDLPKLIGPSVDADEDEDVSSKQDEVGAYEFEEDEPRAWVTLTDSSGAIRHRQLRHLSKDILRGDPLVFERLIALAPCEVPPEEVVAEGMWFEETERTIGFWGGPAAEALLPQVEKDWKGWDVQWAFEGLCPALRGNWSAGKILSVEQALAKLLPVILSTKRFNLATFVSAIGGSLKKTAIKGTGCLLIVICSPLLIFGAVSGNWKAVLITVGVVLLLTIIAFKVIENKIKRGFKSKLSQASIDEDETGPATAGPLDPAERRRTLDKLLSAAGFPS